MKATNLLLFCWMNVSLCSSLLSQDLHWSQPGTALLYYNPAFTGTTGKFSFCAGYRDQWNSVTSSYRTGFASGDYQLGSEDHRQAFNAGLIVYNDVRGGGSYRSNSAGITASSLLKMNTNSYIGIGLAARLVNTTVFADQFSWGSQHNGTNYDPNLPSGENEKTVLGNYSDLQAGIAYIYDQTRATLDYTNNRKVLVGYSADHLSRPNVAVTGGTNKLMIRHCFYSQAFLPAGPREALKPLLVTQLQGPQLECVFGVLYRRSLGQVSQITGIRKGAGFSFGVLYRVLDALIPTLEYERENLLIGFSYDINISKLTPASQVRGGAELSIRLRPNLAAARPVQAPIQPAPSTRTPNF